MSFPKPPRPTRPPVKLFPDGREVCDLKTKAGNGIYTLHLFQMATRQNFNCAICGCKLWPDDITFDHELGRGMNGAHRDDRIEIDGKRHNAAVHLKCNTDKGSKRTPYLYQ